jgi:1-phosphofructokinase
MIYTVTLSPSLDYVMYLPEFTPGTVVRARKEHIYPGGKGINVSLVLARLGFESVALGFTAGFTGRALEEMLTAETLRLDFIRLPAGNTRINVKLKSAQESDINGQGPDIPDECLGRLLEKLDALREGDTLVLAGAIPGSLPEDVYERMLTRLSGKNVLIAVDATGDLLKNSLRHRPFVIKPNSHELGELFGECLTTLESIVACAKKAQALGARNVLVSMAAEGGLLLAEDGRRLKCLPPEGRAVNSVGAGDSMLAGFLAGWHRTGDFEKALRLGVAAGSASAFHEWLANRAEILELLDDPETYHL